MKLKISISMLLLTMLLGLVACGKQEDDNDMPILEEAPCPLELPKSVVQGQDIICGYMTVPEEHDNPERSIGPLHVSPHDPAVDAQ